MSSLQSGRPETSAPFSISPFSEAESALKNPATAVTQADDDIDVFIPHLFDFIMLATEVSGLNRPPVPSMLTEAQAVDSSVLIGQGASFIASKHRVPADRDAESKTGLSIVAKQGAQYRPTHVVYKTARIAFTSTGNPIPRDKRAMSSAMMEIFALVHSPLRKHSNVVKLLGLAWGSNPFEPSHRLPVLMLEYAQHGTLHDLQQRLRLTSEEARCLCLHVALGIDVLHSCGIVHGDVKAENVLIFADEKSTYVAKVADFGFSVVEAGSDAAVYVGGTRPWKAPETNALVPRAALKATDVYSFGLLVWRVANDGDNPFDLILPLGPAGDTYYLEIERMKQADELKAKAKVEVWYLPYIVKVARTRKESDVSLVELWSKLQTYTQHHTTNAASLNEIDVVLQDLILAMRAAKLDSSTMNAWAMQRAQLDCFHRLIDSVIEPCLGKDIDSRNLAQAIDVLSLKSEPRPSHNTSDVLQRSYDHHILSWEQMRKLEPSVQTFVFNAFCSRQELDQAQGEINPPECFILASFYINGLGTEIDHNEAKRLLNFAAINNHEASQAYSYRIWNALTPGFKATQGIRNNLEVSALKGSRTALKDLEIAAPEQVAETMARIRTALAGLGANFFLKDQMLHGLAHWPWQDMLVGRSSIAEKLKGVKDKSNYRVNKRGDGILHMAASCGWSEAVETLIDTYLVPTNLLNDQGETALLCACRAGHARVVHVLLSLGADASISTARKESPLHWLVSFEAEDIVAIVEALLKAGADLRLQTTMRISYSVFRAGIEVDYQQPGSPLAWAVHHDRADIVKYLLDHGRDVSLCMLAPPKDDMSPLLWAAHFHHAECLRLMCDALTRANIVFTYGPLISAAIGSADMFSMILRHGDGYPEKLSQTFDYLLTKSTNISFASGIGLFGCTAVYTAVSRLSDRVVEYLLSDHVKNLLSLDSFTEREPNVGVFHSTHINQACGYEQRTPILESIRLNRQSIFNLLLAHGADLLSTSQNPYNVSEMNWTGLHVLAHAAHNQVTPTPLLDILLDAGVLVDGRPASATTPETPLSIALSSCALHLASHLLSRNAHINALSINNALLVSNHPLTILGHTVAYTSRSTLTRLRFLLHECGTAVDPLAFIVEPERGLTALHRAVWAYREISFLSPEGGPPVGLKWEDIDWEMNRTVVVTLLERFASEDLVRAKCMKQKTALHLAVEAGNVEAVRLLIAWDEKRAEGRGLRMMRDETGETAEDLAMSINKAGVSEGDGSLDANNVPSNRVEALQIILRVLRRL